MQYYFQKLKSNNKKTSEGNRVPNKYKFKGGRLNSNLGSNFIHYKLK